MKEVARNPRFQSGLNQNAALFTASVMFDWRLFPYDIHGSIAHITMLSEAGIVSEAHKDTIVDGLQNLLEQWQKGDITPRIEWEDVHMNVEGYLRQAIGPVAGVLHTARSRNDQVSLDMHLYLKDVGSEITGRLLHLMDTFVDKASEHIEVIIPGYTHLQAAQPVLLAHHLLAYVEMFRRDFARVQDWLNRVDVSPLGAAALSGTPYPTSPERSAELLGMSAVYRNSLDAVSDRDFLLEFLSIMSIFMIHISRLGEELVLWSSHEFGYLTMDDGYSTGSSIMPQKKNPDVAELVRGKTGRVVGHLMALLTVMKGLPLAYDSDMQEDKPAVFDVIDTVLPVLDVVQGMVKTMRINNERIARRLGTDYTAATDLADMLVETGMPFRDAHHVVGTLVGKLERDGLGFGEVTADYLQRAAPEISFDWLGQLTPRMLIERRKQAMSSNPSKVKERIADYQQWRSKKETSS